MAGFNFGTMKNGIMSGFNNLRQNAPGAMNALGSRYGGNMSSASQLAGQMGQNRPGMMKPQPRGMVRGPQQTQQPPYQPDPNAIGPYGLVGGTNINPRGLGHGFRFGNPYPTRGDLEASGYRGSMVGGAWKPDMSFLNPGLMGGQQPQMGGGLWQNYNNLSDDSSNPQGQLYY